MQVRPGAPGTARQENTRTIVSTNDGGVATQPRAPGHGRPRTASFDAARHDRPRATPRAPGADVPPATTAGAPGQYRLSAATRAPGHGRPLAISAGAPCRDRLSAVPSAPDHDRSRARHTMAPGHGRPLAASSDVAGHDRPRATLRAPGADVPLATAAGAPGQYRLSAAQWAHDHFRSCPAQKAPGHGRPLAASSGVAGHDRPRATLKAPGADVPLASTAGAPGQHRLRAMANATVASPAGLRRLRQVILPRTPATPNTLTYPTAHQNTAHTRAVISHASPSPCPAGGPQGGQAQSRQRRNTPLSTMWRGAGGEVLRSPTTHQVHPATQVPPRPRSCSTAGTGCLRQHPSRAPPAPCASLRRKPQSSRTNE